MAPSASTSGGSSGPPRLQSVDDVIQLAVQVASSANPNHDVATILVPALEKLMSLKGGYEVLLQASAGGQDPLSLLDPKTHSVAYMYIVTTRLQVETSFPPPEPPATANLTPGLLYSLQAFCPNFDAGQILMSGSAAGAKLTELARAIDVAEVKRFLPRNDAWYRLKELQTGLASAAPGCLTTLHAIDIAYGRRIGATAYIVEELQRTPPFTRADRYVTPLEPVDVLGYFFEGGQACLDEFARSAEPSHPACVAWLQEAKRAFESCLTAPAHRVPHEMQLLAAARWYLLSLGLADEDDDSQRSTTSSISLPGFTSTAMSRAWKRHATPAYTTLADLYTSRRRSAASVRELHKFVQAEPQMQVWQRDGTLALVMWLLEERHPAARVARLGATFTRLRVRDVVSLLELGAAEQGGNGGDEAKGAVEKGVKEQIEKWIAQGRLKGAKVEPAVGADKQDDAGSAILSFHNQPQDAKDGSSSTTTTSNFSTLTSLTSLRHQMERLQRCNADLEARERDLARSKQFVAKMQSGAAIGRGGPGGMGGMGMGMSMGGMGGGGGAGGRFDMDDEDVFGA